MIVYFMTGLVIGFGMIAYSAAHSRRLSSFDFLLLPIAILMWPVLIASLSMYWKDGQK